MIGSKPATAGHEKVSAGPFTGLRGGAFLGYRWVLLVFLLAGVAQVFLAGLGVFSLEDQGLEAAGDTAFAPHRDLGFTMAGIALLILLLAAIARAPSRARGGPRGLRRPARPRRATHLGHRGLPLLLVVAARALRIRS